MGGEAESLEATAAEAAKPAGVEPAEAPPGAEDSDVCFRGEVFLSAQKNTVSVGEVLRPRGEGRDEESERTK